MRTTRAIRDPLTLSPFEFGDEEDFAAVADWLVIGCFVDLAVDGDVGYVPRNTTRASTAFTP